MDSCDKSSGASEEAPIAALSAPARPLPHVERLVVDAVRELAACLAFSHSGFLKVTKPN